MVKNLLDELLRADEAFQSISTIINGHKKLKIHKENRFNERFSGVLDSFSDFLAIGKRLARNIIRLEELERSIQAGWKKGEKRDISPEEQKLHRESGEVLAENKADFKALYIFAKIFLDEYVTLIRFMYQWRGIGDKSVTNFYHDLEKYQDTDKTVLKFKEICFGSLRAIDVFITQYRDDYIVHHQTKHKVTSWFFVDMRQSIRFLGGRPSIVPSELAYIVANLTSNMRIFIETTITDLPIES